MKPTDVAGLISELGAGVVEEKLAIMISDVASAVVALDGKGEISINLKMEKFGSTDQIKITHKIVANRPKKYGKVVEDDAQISVMYVNMEGNVSQYPEHQMDMLNTTEEKKGVS